MEIKVCTLCNEEKSIEEFPLAYNKKYPDLRKSRCRKCCNKIQEEGRIKNEDRKKYKREQNRLWNQKNREKVSQQAYLRYLKKKAENPEFFKEKGRINYYKKTFGITPEQAQEIINKENGICPICKQESKLVLDHNHITGKIRKAICHHCNAGIGFLKESEKIMLAAIEYLKEHA